MSLNKEHKQAFVELSKGVSAYLQFLIQFGCKGVDCSDKILDIVKSWDLDAIRIDLATCDQCPLSNSRKRAVAGRGDPNAKVVFIGETPEPEDDQTGIPYSGKAGELLTKIIAAMNLNRESVYITHVVKCRSCEKSETIKQDINICKSFLLRELAIIKPKIICAMGDLSVAALLGAPVSIRRCRGRFQLLNGIHVMPTYSTEHLLSHPEDKRAVWDDIQQMMRLYETENVNPPIKI
jgi:uracil-DNA glycosylase